jgi:hypothetical protein
MQPFSSIFIYREVGDAAAAKWVKEQQGAIPESERPPADWGKYYHDTGNWSTGPAATVRRGEEPIRHGMSLKNAFEHPALQKIFNM